jgi:DNA/RNA-binding domain of Phe-tRNA-synthetase-like protein
MFLVSEDWWVTFPNAHAGILAMNHVENPSTAPELENSKRDVENALRAQFAGQDPHALDTFGPIPAYNAYYKPFNKTYHVQGQLTSIIFKGKSIPSVAALVEAMFIAELKNGLLTAGHDLDQVQLPVTLSVAKGNEHYMLLRGQDQILKAGDMLMADQNGVISSIIYGPDQRTQISPVTQNVLFAVYAPAGIDAQTVMNHLEDIRNLVLIFSPQAAVQAMQVFGPPSSG